LLDVDRLTMPTRARVPVFVVAVVGLALAGCSVTSGLAPTQPSGTTQQLLIRSLERALDHLELQRLTGLAVSVEVFILAGSPGVLSPTVGSQGVVGQGFINQGFVREFVTTWLKAHGVRTVTEAADLKLKVFASVLGTDRGETLIGFPAFQAPILNMPVPEIAIFKWTRNRGQTELRVYALNAKTDDFVEQLPMGIGHAKADEFTVLLFIGFSSTDVDRPVP